MPDYRAVVEVMLKPSILDPQGRAVQRALERMGHDNVDALRIGKRIELRLTGERAAVERQLEEIAVKVLSNPVMEEARWRLEEVAP